MTQHTPPTLKLRSALLPGSLPGQGVDQNADADSIQIPSLALSRAKFRGSRLASCWAAALKVQ
jgi:hypothetical protein